MLKIFKYCLYFIISTVMIIINLLPFLLNFDSKTPVTQASLENSFNSNSYTSDQRISNLNFDHKFLNTISLAIDSLLEKIQDGLTLNDIENILFFILFIRFVVLSLRYNIKTSFYITCISLFAGYLWYRHLIDLISMYRSVILKLPFLYKLGIDAVQVHSRDQQILVEDSTLQENISWYNPGQILQYAFKNGILNIDPATGLRHYIDPISMFVSNLQGPIRSTSFSIYYTIYKDIIPKIFDICSKFWAQLSGIAAYAVITRIGKRYCPYLIRWHWTFILIFSLIEQIFIYFIYRAYYFQTFVLIPQANVYNDKIDSSLTIQLNISNAIITGIVLAHIGFIIFGLFHAIWGQYFYVPFFVENTELHIGKRPVKSIYSGGQTAWQSSKEKNTYTRFPRLWYGWFGRGIKNASQNNNSFKKLLQKFLKKLKKQFKN